LKSLLLKTGLFEKGPLLSHLAARLWPSKFEALHRRRTFQAIYKNNHWGSDEAASFYSGAGSRGEVVDIYVERMSFIIRQHQRELRRSVRVLDLGCGDFTVGRQLTERIPEMSYIGCDIVPELIQHHAETEANSRISFRRLDIVTDDLPNADVVLARQVLQHLPNADVECILRKLGKYHAAYITEGQPATAEGPFNPDKPIGSGMRFNWQTGHGRGLEFDKPPFNRFVREICRTTSTPLGQIVTFQVSDQPLQTDPIESAVGLARQPIPVLTSSATGVSRTRMS
jgi:SAM-dependent methyltransferase